MSVIKSAVLFRFATCESIRTYGINELGMKFVGEERIGKFAEVCL